MNWDDLIGSALDIYKAREQSKIDSRLAASQLQAQEFENAWRLQQAQASTAGAVSAPGGWLVPVLLGGVALVVLVKVLK